MASPAGENLTVAPSPAGNVAGFAYFAQNPEFESQPYTLIKGVTEVAIATALTLGDQSNVLALLGNAGKGSEYFVPNVGFQGQAAT